jgi:hypothetical protein
LQLLGLGDDVVASSFPVFTDMDLYIVTAGIKTEEKSGNLGIFF